MRFLYEEDKTKLIIDENGWRSDPERAEAIKNMPSPNIVTNLQAFLDLANYYSIYIAKMNLELHWMTYWKRGENRFGRKNTKLLFRKYKPLYQIYR